VVNASGNALHVEPSLAAAPILARQTLRLTLGTKARNRRGFVVHICRRTSSLAPAFFTLGTNTVSVFAYPMSLLLHFNKLPFEKSDENRR
jgi:hypothetical protein